MHYEVYVDSLFFINFGMNLYLLMLVNRSTFRTASPWRILLGAAFGSVSFLLLFVGCLPPVCRIMAGILVGTVGMLLIAFPIGSVRMFLKLLEKLVCCSFCVGGLMLFLLRMLPGLRRWLTGMWGILAVGGIAFLFFGRFLPGRGERECLCKATLRKDGAAMTVAALVDSGNSLTEPVSGKPVSIVEEKVFRGLWKDGVQGFRAIPYHSIGKNHGILEGYLLPELCLEIGDVKKEFRDVYIAVGTEGLCPSESAAEESVKMIVNPMLFTEGRKGWPRKRQNERTYDSESGNTGKNAV